MTLSEMFSNPFIAGVIFKALIVGTLVSLCAALLGVSLVLKRCSMIGDGLSHVGFGTMALATVVGLSSNFSLVVSIPIVIVAAWFLLRISENSKIKGDAAIGLLSTSAIAVGVILYNYSSGMTTDVCNSMFGSSSVLMLNNSDLILSIVLSCVVLGLYALCYNKIFVVTFDENFASASGVNSQRYKTLISILTAVTVVLGMKMLGAIMISALIIFPALTAMR
ncbi:MAG: metal ABC transporter permease, partial [bacterium]|nr:metal ABC transporter permease [bacterium]